MRSALGEGQSEEHRMSESSRLTQVIDGWSFAFTQSVKARLACLSDLSDEALEWLMLEHYQFSVRNPALLATAAQVTGGFDDANISAELWRNHGEESSHALMYRHALRDIGADVDERVEFAPTSVFLDAVEKLIEEDPVRTLGAMYATETAAIFEHEVFLAISRELILRRGLRFETSKLKAFHDLHLDGVEQGHKDGLAGFVDAQRHSGLSKKEVLSGAEEAIALMVGWWESLLGRASAMRRGVSSSAA
jgi:hypothetical protein